MVSVIANMGQQGEVYLVAIERIKTSKEDGRDPGHRHRAFAVFFTLLAMLALTVTIHVKPLFESQVERIIGTLCLWFFPFLLVGAIVIQSPGPGGLWPLVPSFPSRTSWS